ncbi:MAG: hypothetical protein ACYC26_03435 [Phycisphaerales bacterium]
MLRGVSGCYPVEGNDQAWRIIPAELIDLTPSQATRLAVHQCTASSVAGACLTISTSGIDCTIIAERLEWRDQIIREWPAETIRALKDLPVYARSNGTFTRITDQTFIRGTLPPPPASIFPHLVLIDDPSGAIHARGLAPTLSPEDILRAVLGLPECQKHWQFILASIPDTPSDELRKLLRRARWLPTGGAEGCAPSEVICRNGLLPYVREMSLCGRQLLRSDASTQAFLIEEIRKRLDASSYEAASIPFKLFQNGDDAVVELEALCPNADSLDRARSCDLRRRFAQTSSRAMASLSCGSSIGGEGLTSSV